METSLRYNSNSRSLKVHAKEKFPVNSKTHLQLHGELDTGTGAPSYFRAMIRHFFPEATTGLAVGLHYNKREKLRCHVRGKKEFPVRNDKLVTFNIKGRCDFDQDFNQRNPQGAAEFAWNIINFKEDQDVRIKVGFEMFDKMPYLQIRENNWTLNANMKGKWNLRVVYDMHYIILRKVQNLHVEEGSEIFPKLDPTTSEGTYCRTLIGIRNRLRRFRPRTMKSLWLHSAAFMEA